jgi:glutamate transport system substrate-binding protein
MGLAADIVAAVDTRCGVDVDLRVLGPVGAYMDGSPLAVGGPKQRTVLAYLLVHPNRPVTTAALVDELWPHDPPPSAVPNVTSYLSRIRRALAPAGCELPRHDSAYRLLVRADLIDLHRFAALAACGDAAWAAGDGSAAVSAWRNALALWRGTAFDAAAPGPTLDAVRAEYDERRAVTFQRYAAARIRCGEATEVLAELRRQVYAEPLRETGWLLLMCGLYMSGNPAAALDAYQQARAMLTDQLGVDPTEHLQALHHAILVRDDRAVSAAPNTTGVLAPVAGPAPPAALVASTGPGTRRPPVAGMRVAPVSRRPSPPLVTGRSSRRGSARVRWARLLATIGLVAAAAVAACFPTTSPRAQRDLELQAGLIGKQQLLVGVSDDLPGLSERDPRTGTFSGFEVAIAYLVAADLGFSAGDVRLLPVETEDRQRMQVRDSDRFVTVDLVIAAFSITEDRRRAGVFFSAPYLETEQSVLTRSGHPRIQSLEDLRGREVCVPGTSTSEAIANDDGIDSAPRIEISDCVQSLRRGEVEAVTTDAAILGGFMARYPTELAHHDIGSSAVERWGVGCASAPLCALVDMSLHRSLTDPHDRRWEDAFDMYLRPEQGQSQRQQIAVDHQPGPVALPKHRTG